MAKHLGKPKLRPLGVLSELLATFSVLVFLFAGWLFWFNDVVVADTQQAAAQELIDDWVPPRDFEDHKNYVHPLELAPVMSAPAKGEPFAVMRIPRFGDYVRTISEGISLPGVLNKGGLGHYDGTQMPGEVGNFVVAGHRTTYGAPFKRLHELRSGDTITVETQEAVYTYSVTGSEIVWPNAVSVLNPVPHSSAPATRQTMTLIACHPMFSAAQRIIVYAEMTSWRPR